MAVGKVVFLRRFLLRMVCGWYDGKLNCVRCGEDCSEGMAERRCCAAGR